MKTRTHKFGDCTFRSYFKKVGNNYEIGMKCGTDQIFLGNFVYANEAKSFWTYLQREIVGFKNKFWVARNVSRNWYVNFFRNFLNNCYYTFLEKRFTKHSRTFEKKCNTDVRKWNSLKKNWDSWDRTSFYRKAA